VLMCS